MTKQLLNFLEMYQEKLKTETIHYATLGFTLCIDVVK